MSDPSAQRNSPPRYAIVGTGARSYLYLQALIGEHAEDGELVGLCDANPGRRARAARLAADAGIQVPAFERAILCGCCARQAPSGPS